MANPHRYEDCGVEPGDCHPCGLVFSSWSSYYQDYLPGLTVSAMRISCSTYYSTNGARNPRIDVRIVVLEPSDCHLCGLILLILVE
jgi:hypothetical protein